MREKQEFGKKNAYDELRRSFAGSKRDPNNKKHEELSS